jgi:hypothetical protein
MHTIVKFFYLLLFLSVDVLLYLRLNKKDIRVKKWLFIALVILIITIIIHLPTFKIPYLMVWKYFVILFGMVIQLVIAYYITLFMIRRVERSAMAEELKIYPFKMLSVVNKGIFFLFMIVHSINILAWP